MRRLRRTTTGGLAVVHSGSAKATQPTLNRRTPATVPNAWAVLSGPLRFLIPSFYPLVVRAAVRRGASQDCATRR